MQQPTLPTVRRALLVPVLVLCTVLPARAQAPEPKEEEKKVGWLNSTELSLVATEGNSSTEATGFKDTLTHRWTESWMTVRLDVVRTITDDDRYQLVDPGYTWLPGEALPPFTTTVVDPPSEPDVEKYFFEGRFDKKTGPALSWNSGASWDRNSDAGILNRYIVFAGVGHVWQDTDDRKLHTSYGLSWTDREEETPDPEKDRRFLGVRLGSRYSEKLGKVTTYKNDTTFNMSLADSSDYSVDMVNSVAVAMNRRLSLKVSLQWLYNNEPALEDVDVVARVILVDPDGVPGGQGPGGPDEYFQTVTEGGYEITTGEARERKKPLDTILNASLVINF